MAIISKYRRCGLTTKPVRVLDAFVGPSPSTPDRDSSVFPSGSLTHSKPCHFGISPLRFRNIPVHSPLHPCWGQALDPAYPRRGYRTCCQTRCLGELLHQCSLWLPQLAPKRKPRAGASTSIPVVWTSMVSINYTRHRLESPREAPNHSSHGCLKLGLGASSPGIHPHELAPSDVPKKTLT